MTLSTVPGLDPEKIEGMTARTETGEQEIPAEVVVATGRTSRTPAWLERHGYPSPTTDEVSIDLADSTAVVERPADEHGGRLVLPDPPRKRGCGIFPVENRRWLVTLVGMHGDHPPTDLAGFRDFAASLPVPDVTHLLDEHGPVTGELSQSPIPSNRRRRSEELDRFSDGHRVSLQPVQSVSPVQHFTRQRFVTQFRVVRQVTP